MKAERGKLFHALAVLAFCLVVIAGSAVAGYLYLAAERRSVVDEARNRLAAIADMKVRQLSAWRAERLAEAKALESNPLVIPGVLESLTSGRNRGEIETWLGQLMEAYDYTAAGLWDRAFRRRVWLPASEPVHDVERDLVMEAMHARTSLLVDLYRDEPTSAVHMALVVPLLSTSSPEPIGALLLEIDPERFLYPVLQTWPTPSRSAETWLVRREGDDVVYLNELRHRKNTPLSLRFPLDRADLPAARAVLGFEGVMEGVDYRGTAVLAASRHVPDSPWYLVAKVDSEEVLAPLRARTRLIATTFGLLAVALIAGIMVLWSRQETRAHRQQHEAELERRAILGHFGYLSRYANDIILLLDAPGRIIEANDRAGDAYGYSGDELPQMNVAELHAPEHTRTFHQTWARVKEKGSEGLVFETEHLRKDGRRLPVEVSARVIEVEGREFRQEIIRDITERKRAEEELRAKEYVLSESQSIAHVGSWSIDLATGTVTWTPETYRLYGVSPGTFVPSSETLLSLIHADDRAAMQGWMAACLAGEEPPPLEFRAPLSDGGVRYLYGHGSLIRDAENQPIRMAGIVQDITERRRAEEALRKSEERHRTILQTAMEGFWLVDTQGRLLEVSEAYSRMSGYSVQELLAMTIADLEAVESPVDIAARVQQILARGEDLFQSRHRRKDGSIFDVEISVQYRPSDDGRLVVFLRDITERKRTEEAVQQLNAELEQRVRDRTAQLEAANRELESFSYSVSHDLRGPLRGIDGWSLALVEEYRDKLDAQACEYLDYIRSDAQRMGQLIDDILRLAQVSRGHMERALVDMGAISQSVAARLQKRQPTRRVEFTVQPGLTAWGDASLLEIALTNLIDNAWKFSSKRPVARIEFGRTEVDGRLAFFVRDNGVGFDMTYVHKLFGAFQRLHKASEFPGTGIGLAIVQRVVHRHNGRVWAESKPDGGATFYFTLEEAV